MNLEYAIVAIVGISYNQDSILNVLERGSKIGFSYYFTNLEELDSMLLKPAHIQSALVAIMEGFPEDVMNVITARYEDTFVNLYFIAGNNLTIMLYDFEYPWIKMNDGHELDEVDLIRYVKLMLELIEP